MTSYWIVATMCCPRWALRIVDACVDRWRVVRGVQ